MPTGGRVDLVDNCWVFVPTFLVFFALTGAFKYSVVAATFALVNFNLITHWFAIAPSDEAQMQRFLQNLRVAAHRGAQADAPENTMYAFRQSIAEGADAVELDVEITKDGIAVLLHDETVDRTTDGTGLISAMFAHQAQKLNAAAKFSGPPITHKFEPIPLLEEALKLCIEKKVRVFIDVKATNKQVIQILLKSFRKYPELYDSAAVCSFHPQVVYEVKRNDPRIITGHTWRPGFYTYSDVEMRQPRSQNFFVHNLAKMADLLMEWFLHTWMWKFTGVNLLLANNRMISANYAITWQKRGVHVVAWTVNDHDEKLHLLHDLKCPIITDSLRDLKSELKIQSAKDGHCVREGGSDKTSCSTTDDSAPTEIHE